MVEIALRCLVIIVFCLPLLSCSRGTVSASADAQSPAAAARVASGRNAVAVIGSGHDEADEAVVASVSADLCAVHVGVVPDMAAARVAAGKAGATTLVACEVVSYSAYDPSRVGIAYTVTDAGWARPSWRDVMRRSRRASSRDDVGYDGPRESVTGVVEVDAGDERTLNEYAAAKLGERWGQADDLLEAEILLRDPARFLPFAAARVVDEVRTAVMP